MSSPTVALVQRVSVRIVLLFRGLTGDPGRPAATHGVSGCRFRAGHGRPYGRTVRESAAPVPSPGRAVDVPVPSGDRLAAAYLLGIADDAMVYAQRLGEWLTNAPQIEEDMALANVSLDLLGQARGLYPRVGVLDGTGRSEDDFAMLRDEREWRSVHLVEQERGDFGFEMARLLWFSAYQVELYAAAAGSSDEIFRAVAEKATKEVAYHHDHAHQWVVRLGDGTEESHRRMQAALEAVSLIWQSCSTTTRCLSPRQRPASGWSLGAPRRGGGTRGRSGRGGHPHAAERLALALARWTTGRAFGLMGYLLAEMQHLARSHPGATW